MISIPTLQSGNFDNFYASSIRLQLRESIGEITDRFTETNTTSLCQPPKKDFPSVYFSLGEFETFVTEESNQKAKVEHTKGREGDFDPDFLGFDCVFLKVSSDGRNCL